MPNHRLVVFALIGQWSPTGLSLLIAQKSLTESVTKTIQQGSLCTYSLCRKPKLIFHRASLWGQNAITTTLKDQCA